MELDHLTACWRTSTRAEAPPLEEWAVLQIVSAKSDEARARSRRRLRREAVPYLVVLIISVAGLSGEKTPRSLIMMEVITVFLAGIPLTLWFEERRLAQIPLSQPLRDVLTAFIARLDAAGRAYLRAYVAVVGAGGAAGAVMIGHRAGFWAGVLAALALVGGVAWAYQSGAAYVSRVFGRERDELADCLRRLDAGPEPRGV